MAVQVKNVCLECSGPDHAYRETTRDWPKSSSRSRTAPGCDPSPMDAALRLAAPIQPSSLIPVSSYMAYSTLELMTMKLRTC